MLALAVLSGLFYARRLNFNVGPESNLVNVSTSVDDGALPVILFPLCSLADIYGPSNPLLCAGAYFLVFFSLSIVLKPKI